MADTADTDAPPPESPVVVFVRPALALLLKHAIGRKLQQAGLDLSAEEALGALATVQLLDLELPQGESKRLVTRGSRRAQQVLQALGIRDRRPPGGPAQKPRM